MGKVREATPGEFEGDADIRSSGEGSSSSAFRFRAVGPLCGKDTTPSISTFPDIAADRVGTYSYLNVWEKGVRYGADEGRLGD